MDYSWNFFLFTGTAVLVVTSGYTRSVDCSGIKGSMYKVMKSFIYRGCSNPVISTGHTSVDISASANLEVVDKFCYLGDMLSVDGDADAAVEARIRTGWNKFRHLVPLLTDRDISLIRRGRLYSSCVQSSMLHGSETWPVRKENKNSSGDEIANVNFFYNIAHVEASAYAH